MVNADDVAELEALADIVVRRDLGGGFFPLFVRSVQADTGYEPMGSIRRIAAEVEQSRRCWTPAEIAACLRNAAEKLKAEEGNP
jgi:hypothetical protein